MKEDDDDIFEPQDHPPEADYLPHRKEEGGFIRETITASIETPFLPPQFVQEYDRIVPGAGQQMFDMFVKQQDFNIELRKHEMQLNTMNMQRIVDVDNANIMEQKAVSSVRDREVSIKSRGQIFAFVLVCGLMTLSGFFAFIDQPWLASLPIGMIIGVITVMFLQKKHNEKKVEPSE